MKAQHTPTPWTTSATFGRVVGPVPTIYPNVHETICNMVDSQGRYLPNSEANAAHIVHCVNTHDETALRFEELCDAAQLVIDRWESGDLADAVNSLATDLHFAKIALAAAKKGGAQ